MNVNKIKKYKKTNGEQNLCWGNKREKSSNRDTRVKKHIHWSTRVHASDYDTFHVWNGRNVPRIK